MNTKNFISHIIVILAIKIAFLYAVIRWDTGVFLKVILILLFDSVTYMMAKKSINETDER